MERVGQWRYAVTRSHAEVFLKPISVQANWICRWISSLSPLPHSSTLCHRVGQNAEYNLPPQYNSTPIRHMKCLLNCFIYVPWTKYARMLSGSSSLCFTNKTVERISTKFCIWTYEIKFSREFRFYLSHKNLTIVTTINGSPCKITDTWQKCRAY